MRLFPNSSVKLPKEGELLDKQKDLMDKFSHYYPEILYAFFHDVESELNLGDEEKWGQENTRLTKQGEFFELLLDKWKEKSKKEIHEVRKEISNEMKMKKSDQEMEKLNQEMEEWDRKIGEAIKAERFEKSKPSLRTYYELILDLLRGPTEEERFRKHRMKSILIMYDLNPRLFEKCVKSQQS
ncbi:MAG: hypothetical protein IJV04_09420 [Lachnospiraceae bacterium]|nr:hypothetical protein [Lachnospiraceae bacterium]